MYLSNELIEAFVHHPDEPITVISLEVLDQVSRVLYDIAEEFGANLPSRAVAYQHRFDNFMCGIVDNLELNAFATSVGNNAVICITNGAARSLQQYADGYSRQITVLGTCGMTPSNAASLAVILSEVSTRMIFAHEMGHLEYGHVGTGSLRKEFVGGGSQSDQRLSSQKEEIEADMFMASWLHDSMVNRQMKIEEIHGIRGMIFSSEHYFQMHFHAATLMFFGIGLGSGDSIQDITALHPHAWTRLLHTQRVLHHMERTEHLNSALQHFITHYQRTHGAALAAIGLNWADWNQADDAFVSGFFQMLEAAWQSERNTQ